MDTMKATTIPAEKIEPGYRAWKREKIERAKAQAGDRASMIPAEQVWRDLGLGSYFTPDARHGT